MSEQAESDRLRLRSVFSRVFQIPIGGLPATIDTEAIATWDSLAHLSLIEEIEQEFGIRFSQAEAIAVFSEADIIRILTGKSKK